MNEHVKAYLSDVLHHAANVMEFTAGRTLDEYLDDVYFRSAVERQLELMGDTVGLLLRAAPELEPHISHARRVVDCRNRLAHAYRSLINAVVWNIAQQYVPPLRAEVEALLASDEACDD